MIAAIFIVPILYFFNAFMIGRYLKRFKISLNPFFSTIFGFFSIFAIFYFIDVFLYVANANILTYIIFYSLIQIGLLVIYAINWKKIFITFSVDVKKIVTFVATAGMTILISWLCLRNLNSEFAVSWVKTINNLPQTSLNNCINFRTTENDVISNFSSQNIFNIFWINCFNINGFENCLNFCQWSWIICGSLIMGCIATWLMPEKSHIARVIISPIICLCFITVILAFIESFAICDTWIFLQIFVYILVLIKRETFSNLKLLFLTVLLLSILATNCTSIYVVICLWLFSIYWAIRNKENSLNYLVFLSWPLVLAIFTIVTPWVFWILAFGNGLCFLLIAIILAIFIKKGSPVWASKFARSIAKNSGKIVYSFIGIITAIILVTNFFIFHEIYQWNGSKINYQNFLTFTYKYIWSFELNNSVQVAIINGILYFFFAALIVTFIVARNMKKSKLYSIAKNDSALKLAITSAAFFINPLVIHVLKFSTSSFQVSLPINTLNLNILFVAPLFVTLLRLNYNYKIRTLQTWAYDWY